MYKVRTDPRKEALNAVRNLGEHMPNSQLTRGSGLSIKANPICTLARVNIQTEHLQATAAIKQQETRGVIHNGFPPGMKPSSVKNRGEKYPKVNCRIFGGDIVKEGTVKRSGE